MAASLCRQFQPLKVNPHTNEPYLQLPAPHDNIIITPPRLSDAEAITGILNDARVYKTLIGPPFPYLLEHAEEWLASCKQKSDAVFDTLKDAAEKNSHSEQHCRTHVDDCPIRTLREVQEDETDNFIGEIGISRCERFDYLRDKEKEAVLVERNSLLPVGSPEIIWDIGDYLAPSHHGKGIMSAALRAIIQDWAITQMNVHVIHGMAFTGNAGSVRVFVKNDFEEFDSVDGCVTLPESKGGGVIGLHFLKWRRLV